MQRTEHSCVELADELFPAAEKELAAYARAVQELFGSEQARQSIDEWLGELESMDVPDAGAVPDWRRVTIAAAMKLAIRNLTQGSRMQLNSQHSFVKRYKGEDLCSGTSGS